MYAILFVCPTNISLSPLAAAIFAEQCRKAGEGRIRSESAGTAAGKTARTADHRIQNIAAAHGLDLSAHRSRRVDELNLADYDLVLTMDQDDFWTIKQMLPKGAEKPRIQVLTEYAGHLGLTGIADPLLGETDFGEAYERISKTTAKLLTAVQDRLLGSL